MPVQADLRSKATPAKAEQRVRPATGTGPQAGALSRVAATLNGGSSVAGLNGLSAALSPPPGRSDPPLQLKADAVVQRSVLHRQNDEGEIVYYSDLEVVGRGQKATTFKTYEEAEVFDRRLAATPTVLQDALTTGQDRERRAPTPFGHLKAKPQAKVRHQDQGPHSLSFSAFEQRLQNRLRKSQHAELEDQVLPPEEAGARMTEEYGLAASDPRHRRYMLDYRSLYKEFQRRLAEDTERGVNSAFHLVARKLLQLNPYTSYSGPRSTNRGEDRHGRLGSGTIDTSAKFKNRKNYEKYLQTRGDMFHSSDEEEEGFEPRVTDEYRFKEIESRQRRYSRKRKASVLTETAEGGEGEVRRDSVSGGGRSTSSPAASSVVAPPPRDDVAVYQGHRFRPQTRGIRDGGECLWDTLRHYGFKDDALTAAARAAGVTVDQHVDARDMGPLLRALGEQTGQRVAITLVTFDILTLRPQAAVTIGESDRPLFVGLFMQGEDGHYVPES